MLNFTDSKYEEKVKVIFNNGNAGIVRNCDARIESKKPTDDPLSPLYKIYFKDPNNGAEINRAYFAPKDSFVNEKQELFFMREMKHILTQCNANIPNQNWSRPVDILSYVMETCKDLITKEHFAVAVCFGNTKKPSQFLEVNGFWDFRNEKLITEASPFIMNKEALLNRVTPTDPVQPKTSEMKDDLPF